VYTETPFYYLGRYRKDDTRLLVGSVLGASFSTLTGDRKHISPMKPASASNHEIFSSRTSEERFIWKMAVKMELGASFQYIFLLIFNSQWQFFVPPCI